MAIPDPRYIPKAKGKKKAVKVKRVAPTANFPVPTKRPELKTSKKASPFGDKHVWAN